MVPWGYIEDSFNLGGWLSKQRQQKKIRKLDRGYERQLEDVGIMWDILSEQSEKNYCLIIKF